jgi:hypothetical protein
MLYQERKDLIHYPLHIILLVVLLGDEVYKSRTVDDAVDNWDFVRSVSAPERI